MHGRRSEISSALPINDIATRRGNSLRRAKAVLSTWVISAETGTVSGNGGPNPDRCSGAPQSEGLERRVDRLSIDLEYLATSTADRDIPSFP